MIPAVRTTLASRAPTLRHDPLFWLAEQDCTSAELPAEVKNRLSHRGQATRLLVAMLHEQGAEFAGS